MFNLTRRSTLLGLATVFSSLRGSLAFASANTDRRFVVINLRGAMDGMTAVVPYGDPALKALRAPLVPPGPGQPEGLLDLGGFFGLNPMLPSLHGMYKAGELAIIHAVAGPYRERSHSIAQDMLESGAEQRLSSGWLNRAVGEKHSVACPSALIGASNFFELAVAAAISLFGFNSGAALATVVGVLIEVPVMLLVVYIVNNSKGWYERGASVPGA